jgi:hypothetical protein
MQIIGLFLSHLCQRFQYRQLNLEDLLALEPRLIEPRWLLYCEFKSNYVFVEGDSGEMTSSTPSHSPRSQQV